LTSFNLFLVSNEAANLEV